MRKVGRVSSSPSDADAPLPADVALMLSRHGVTAYDEVALRRALEQRVDGFNLFKLTRAAARRWKCRYRILLGAGYYDGQSAAEAYARALLATLDANDAAPTTPHRDS
jgi:hypothetical protein